MISKYDYLTVNGELSHHGILGMKWGRKQGPPYPLDPEDHSASERKAGWRKSLDDDGASSSGSKKSSSNETSGEPKKPMLSDKQKKILKAGAIAAGTALAAYGAYKIGSNPDVQAAVRRGIETLKGKSNAFSSEQLKEMGIEVTDIDRVDVNKINFDVKGDIVNINNGRSDNSGNSIKFNAKDINPTGGGNNCKHVAEATIKRALGIDSNATAVGDDSHVSGNLHDFVKKQGYNPSGVTFLGGDQGYIAPDPSGDSKGRVTRQILKKFNDGDVGMIGFRYDPKLIYGSDIDLSKLEESDFMAHAFNFKVSGQDVEYVCNQSESSRGPNDYFKEIDPNSGIEVVRITKEAFNKRE